tara:strand:- start:4402 stop:5709 length:1308 start_codon:yes stop_codon:yes gene_type:complete
MKPELVISCPATSRSGYGDHSRDIIRSFIAMDKFNVKVLDQVWGGCPRNSLTSGKDDDIISRLITSLNAKPNVWVQITVPNEFQPVGEYNIGITAGMETDLVSAEWVAGCNRMNMIIVPSEHSKFAFENTIYDQTDKNSGNVTGQLKVEKPVHVLFEGLDTNVFNKISEKEFKKESSVLIDSMKDIKEDYCFLFVGHWLQGEFGHDRKDIGGLIQTFIHSFKDKSLKNQPALILKTSSATYSIKDREEILKKINTIKSYFRGVRVPPIYLLHGDVEQNDLNRLYNHPKVKAMVSFTHGEGFGRPLLEFGMTGKPVIASNWSGHVDFISEYGIGLPGELKQVHKSAVWDKVIIPESKWFYVNYGAASNILKECHSNYKDINKQTRKQTQYIKDNFTIEKMNEVFANLIKDNVPQFSVQVPLKLPKLPKLKKVGTKV